MDSDRTSKRGGKRLLGNSVKPSTEFPLVTVITAVYNGQEFLPGCIESVLNQDYPNLEHLVLDGGSSDGTVDVLQHYDQKIEYWKSEPDKGVYDAWNKGLELARGEWIAFLGADDIYLPGAVSAYINVAWQNPEAEFLSSRARLDHPTGYSPIFGGPWAWPRFAKAMSTIHVGSMHSQSMFKRLGRFDSTYRIAGDYEFMLRAKGTLRAAFTERVTVVMRAGGLSDSTAGLYEARRAKLHNGVRSRLFAELELRQLILRFYLRDLYLMLRAKVS